MWCINSDFAMERWRQRKGCVLSWRWDVHVRFCMSWVCLSWRKGGRDGFMLAMVNELQSYCNSSNSSPG